MTYTFSLYSMNRIFVSETSADISVKIGVVPSKPGQPEYLYQEFTGGSITIGWKRPESEGGWPLVSYYIWVDDGAGNWPETPIV